MKPDREMMQEKSLIEFKMKEQKTATVKELKAEGKKESIEKFRESAKRYMKDQAEAKSRKFKKEELNPEENKIMTDLHLELRAEDEVKNEVQAKKDLQNGKNNSSEIISTVFVNLCVLSVLVVFLFF